MFNEVGYWIGRRRALDDNDVLELQAGYPKLELLGFNCNQKK